MEAKKEHISTELRALIEIKNLFGKMESILDELPNETNEKIRPRCVSERNLHHHIKSGKEATEELIKECENK